MLPQPRLEHEVIDDGDDRPGAGHTPV
jgi:hypothetical protein